MYLMMQQPEGDDYVLATGELHSVRELVERCFAAVDMKIKWEGDTGLNEVGMDEYDNTVVRINPDFYRPAEVELLLGNPQKAKDVLGWEPKYTFESMIDEMMETALT
jgi:GDPmannose 4,6-dehydratase